MGLKKTDADWTTLNQDGMNAVKEIAVVNESLHDYLANDHTQDTSLWWKILTLKTQITITKSDPIFTGWALWKIGYWFKQFLNDSFIHHNLTEAKWDLNRTAWSFGD